jgi:16S rRNA processing protein RimM
MSGHAARPAGSPTAGEPAFIAVGKVRRPHGVTGEFVVEIYTDFPERLKPGKVLYAGEKHNPVTIRSERVHAEGLLMAFEGYSTPEQVGRFRNQILYIPKAERSDLPEGEFYYDELLGLRVVDETGNLLGELTEIMETGANDVYVVTDSKGKELLLPAISEVVLDIDLPGGMMKVHLLPGILDPEE